MNVEPEDSQVNTDTGATNTEEDAAKKAEEQERAKARREQLCLVTASLPMNTPSDVSSINGALSSVASNPEQVG